LPVVGRATAGLIEVLRVFAQQEETVLVSGPTGAGKSRLARWCHEQSQRKGKPFETLDLLSVPEELQMAELFGWKRGAFTGAMKDSVGAIARASQGTLFIDEIDKLSLKAQAGMLRVLEERRYRPLGDEGAERRADVRFVIGTNADLRALVRAGKFREDLYYRINVLPVRLPALAERLDELPLWAEYMLGRRHEESGGSGAVRIAREAIDVLAGVPWPGNLRQLDNIIRRAYAISLSDRVGAGNDLVLARRHVERALAYDASPETGALVEQLWRAASAFVQEAERRGPSAGPLSLDMTDAFRGLVLAAAVQRRGRDDAFVLLGQQQLLKGRNHHRALKRELERVRELLRVVGGDVDPALAAVLDAAEESGEGR
jgi:DNA-binding NtrC family response regulator